MADLRLFLVVAVLCAVSVQANRNARIVGGVAHDISAAPWLVQQAFEIEQSGTTYRYSSCGGVIISDRHILTAAHCFDGKDEYIKNPQKHILVLAGSTAKYTLNNGKHEGTFYRIKSAKINPEYKKKVGFLWRETKNFFRQDIALLETVEPIQFNDKVQPIEIAKEKPAGNTLVYAGGYGHNNTELSKDYWANFNPELHIATLEVTPDKDCQQKLETVELEKEDREWLICTRNIDGSICQGDSGGPLWNHVEGQPPRLVGLSQSVVSCHLHSLSMFVDIADPEIKKFLRKNKINV